MFSVFGIPYILISDEGSYFYKVFRDTLVKYGVKQHMVTATLSAPNMWESRSVKQGNSDDFSVSMNANKNDWSQQHDDSPSAYHTAFKTTIGMSPYQLEFRKACHPPVDL